MRHNSVNIGLAQGEHCLNAGRGDFGMRVEDREHLAAGVDLHTRHNSALEDSRTSLYDSGLSCISCRTLAWLLVSDASVSRQRAQQAIGYFIRTKEMIYEADVGPVGAEAKQLRGNEFSNRFFNRGLMAGTRC